MATIKTSLQLYDGMSPAFRSITSVMGTVINSFESLQGVADNPINVASIQHAREELAKANVAFDNIERNINQDTEAQKRLNDQIRNGEGAANSLGGTFLKIGAMIGAAIGGKKIIGLSDELTTMNARLTMMNDGLQTNDQLQKMIYASAERSRGSFLGSADAIGKMGIMAKDSFSSTQEVIGFIEQVNKQFTISGTSAQGVEAAMLQLTQAMGSGVLRGEELNSIFEQAPTIIQSIAKYLDVPIGKIRQMAQDGQITAQVVKAAMFAMADETNKKFESMPKTWGQIFQSFQNKAIMVFRPLLAEINKIANSSDFNDFQTGVIGAMVSVASVVGQIFGMIVSLGSMIYNNWSWIEPIVYGVVGALLLFNATSLITNGILAAQAFAAKISAASLMLQEGATFSATVAQTGLNAALWACPITWIVAAVIALIVVFYVAIGLINKFAGTSLSATGIILGAFMVAFAFIGNIFIGFFNLVADVFGLVWNIIATFIEFFANVFNDPVGSILRLFGGLADGILQTLQTIAKAIDTLFGSNLAKSVQGWRDSLGEKVKSVAGEASIKIQRYDPSQTGLKRFDYGNAFDVGNKAGKNIESKLSLSGLKQDGMDFASALAPLNANMGKTADNTAKMKDKMDITSEELKYMKDLAEQDVVNRFTTASINVNMKNNMKVNNNMDLDGIVSHLENTLNEKLTSTAEGVHA